MGGMDENPYKSPVEPKLAERVSEDEQIESRNRARPWYMVIGLLLGAAIGAAITPAGTNGYIVIYVMIGSGAGLIVGIHADRILS